MDGDAAILKVLDSQPGVLDDQRRLVRVVEGLRSQGYPAPEYLCAGETDGVVFTVQRWIPGAVLEPGPGTPPDPAVLDAVLPAVLAAIEIQADAGDLHRVDWPGWLLETIHSGGRGYCLHETMRRRDETASILDRVRRVADVDPAAPPRTTDVVHFDLNPANILHVDGQLTGIVDWNVPFEGATQGDRGFDIATLLFYAYDIDAVRTRLSKAAVAVSGPAWTAVYLAHLVLRQVEWTVRHRPDSAEEQRFLQVATMVLDDCEACELG